jgi:hypothetical protein
MWHVWGRGEMNIRETMEEPEEEKPFGRPRRRWGDNIKMDHREMGRGGTDWITKRIWWGNPWKRTRTEDLRVHGKVILKWILEKLDGGGMNWIDLAQDRDRWQALVNAGMKLRVP